MKHWKLVEGAWVRIDGIVVTPTAVNGLLVWLVQFPWAWIEDELVYDLHDAEDVHKRVDQRFPLPAWMLPPAPKAPEMELYR